MDSRGRLAEQPVVRGLGWLPGTPTEVRVSGGLVVVAAGVRAVSAVTTDGHLRLPATVRHRVGLRSGDRVLLVGRPAENVVILYPPAAPDVVLAGPVPESSGGRHPPAPPARRDGRAGAVVRSRYDPQDLDPTQCLIFLREKGQTVRWQPVSPTLMTHLRDHAAERKSPPSGHLLRYGTCQPV